MKKLFLKIWTLLKTMLVVVFCIVMYACYIPYGLIRSMVDVDQFSDFLQFISDWTVHFRDKVFTLRNKQ